MANSVHPDQTAPLGALWSGTARFAQTYLSENLGSLRYLFLWAGTQQSLPSDVCAQSVNTQFMSGAQ